jgi:hypothetical protein
VSKKLVAFLLESFMTSTNLAIAKLEAAIEKENRHDGAAYIEVMIPAA